MSTRVSVEMALENNFNGSLHREARKNWVTSPYNEDYNFGNRQLRGLGILDLIPVDTEKPVILDIGAGRGRFLDEAKRSDQRDLRAIGFNATDSFHGDYPNIDWVFGDFQRPTTWNPAGTLGEGSVDLAFENLTFMHLADPLGSIATAFHLLRPGGHLLVGDVWLPLLRGEGRDIDSIMAETLARHSVHGQVDLRPSYADPSTNKLCGLHLIREADEVFDRSEIQTVVDHTGTIAYAPA